MASDADGWTRRNTDSESAVRCGLPVRLMWSVDLPQHPYQHRPERPVLLAVDQQLGEGAVSGLRHSCVLESARTTSASEVTECLSLRRSRLASRSTPSFGAAPRGQSSGGSSSRTTSSSSRPWVPLIALGSAASDNTPFDKSAGVAGARFAVLTGVAFFALILPNAAAGTRRLHDTGKPGGGGSSRLSRSVRSSCSCSGRAPGTVGGTSTDRLQASRRLNPPRQRAPCRRHRPLPMPRM